MSQRSRKRALKRRSAGDLEQTGAIHTANQQPIGIQHHEGKPIAKRKKNRRSRKPRKVSTVTSQDPSTPPANGSPFMDLPAEVRVEIYRHLFDTNYIAIVFNSYNRTGSGHAVRSSDARSGRWTRILAQSLSVFLRLLSTCSLVRGEAWPVLAQQTTIDFNGRPDWNSLPKHLVSSFMPHVEQISLPEPYALPDRTLLEKMPNLKKITSYPYFGRIRGKEIKKELLEDFIPSIMGGRDKEYLEAMKARMSEWAEDFHSDHDSEDDPSHNSTDESEQRDFD